MIQGEPVRDRERLIWMSDEARVKPTLDIRPDLVAMAADIAAGERAVTAAMRDAGTGLKFAGRGADRRRRTRVAARQLDPVQVFPKAGASLNAAALVWSKAPVIIGAHDTGPLIRSKRGFWLAIPTPAAGKAHGGGASRRRGGNGRPGCGCGSSIAEGPEPAGGGRGGSTREGRAVASRSKNGPGPRDRADLPAGAAGQAAKAARPGAGRGPGRRRAGGDDRGEQKVEVGAVGAEGS